MRRIKHWGRVIHAGFWTLPAIVSYIILIVGGSVALTFSWSRRHLLWGIVLLLLGVVVVVLEGSYRESKRAEDEHKAKLAEQQAEHEEALKAVQAAREDERGEQQVRALGYCLSVNFKGKPATQPRDSDRQQIETGYVFTLDLQNNSAQAMMWEMEDFVITLNGGYTARPDQKWGSTSGPIPPQCSTPLYYHWLPAPIEPLLGGIGQFSVVYWHPLNGPGGPRFRTRQKFSIRWTAYPGQVAEAHMVVQGAAAHDLVEAASADRLRRPPGCMRP
jgi:Ca2+/Na+ antiporter